MPTPMNQQLKLCFGNEPPSVFQRHLWTDPANPTCPFHGVVGNDEAVQHLCGVAFDALGDQFRDCGGGSFVLAGRLSVAQDLVRRFAGVVKLPMIEIQSQVPSMNDVLVQIGAAMEETWVQDPYLGRTNLELVANGNRLQIPPCIVFLNGLESFPKHVAHGLAAALLHPERTLGTEVGWVVDTGSVCWAVTTRSVVDGLAASLPVISLRESSEQITSCGAMK